VVGVVAITVVVVGLPSAVPPLSSANATATIAASTAQAQAATNVSFLKRRITGSRVPAGSIGIG
jgi:hypothetical protein